MEKDDLIFNNSKITNNKTAYGEGIYYIGDDGRKYATPEGLAEANRFYWNSMKNNTLHRDIEQRAEFEKSKMDLEKRKYAMHSYIGKDGREYRTTDDLERANEAYFDYLNSKLDINDKNMGEEMSRAQQDNNRGPKR